MYKVLVSCIEEVHLYQFCYSPIHWHTFIRYWVFITLPECLTPPADQIFSLHSLVVRVFKYYRQLQSTDLDALFPQSYERSLACYIKAIIQTILLHWGRIRMPKPFVYLFLTINDRDPTACLDKLVYSSALLSLKLERLSSYIA